jgi:hypothetical protein
MANLADVKIVIYAKNVHLLEDRMRCSIDFKNNMMNLNGPKVLFEPYVQRDESDPKAPLVITGYAKWWVDFDCFFKWAMSLYAVDDSILRIKAFITESGILAASCYTAVRYKDTIKLFAQNMSGDEVYETLFKEDDPEEGIIPEDEVDYRYDDLEYLLEQQKRDSLVCLSISEYRMGIVRPVNQDHNEP